MKKESGIKEIIKNSEYIEKIDEMRNVWMIACFTEQCSNAKMWSQYAEGNKGICLVYDVLDVLNKIASYEGMSIMPVRYVEERNKYKDIYLNHEDLLEFNDETGSKFQLTCTTKEKSNYSFEEEWRLIYEKAKSEQEGEQIGENIPFVNPRKIICGDLVDKKSIEYQRLLDIAKEKGIQIIWKQIK